MTTDRKSALDAAMAVLATLGVSVEEIIEHAAQGGTQLLPERVVPTVAEYTPLVAAVAPDGARKTYEPYWRLLVEILGENRLDKVTVLDLKRVKTLAKERAVARRNSRGGVSAQEHAVGAMRAVFRQAREDGHIKEDPSRLVPKPRRKPSIRRALSTEELSQVWEVVASGGDDPHLDILLVRFFIETGARRGGALALRLRDIRTDRQQVRLREKGDTQRWQPVSKTLLDALLAHATERGATADDDPVFRYRPRQGATVGRPLTRRRLNTLADRIQSALPWAGELGVSPHWFRHTATSAVERGAGYAVAKAFAGHAGAGETTMTYIKANESEVARAVVILSGEEHPLARNH